MADECAYGKNPDQVKCKRTALPGWSTCARHYTGGKKLKQGSKNAKTNRKIRGEDVRHGD